VRIKHSSQSHQQYFRETVVFLSCIELVCHPVSPYIHSWSRSGLIDIMAFTVATAKISAKAQAKRYGNKQSALVYCSKYDIDKYMAVFIFIRIHGDRCAVCARPRLSRTRTRRPPQPSSLPPSLLGYVSLGWNNWAVLHGFMTVFEKHLAFTCVDAPWPTPRPRTSV
jgi:hypothetical protein